jgi:uncharacterized membrane protein YhiD involved in acid resistance
MQEFLSAYSKIENPTVEMILFTFILSFILSALVAFTYDRTTLTTFQTTNFIQSLILSAIIATMILQAIGDNVASGLGMLGALTIIQFRTTMKNPRDIIFMFAALGSGIACGLYGFFIAILGVVIFCILAVFLRFSPFHYGHHVIWELRIKTNHGEKLPDDFYKILTKYCRHATLDAINFDKNKDNAPIKDYEFKLLFKDDAQHLEFVETLEAAQISVKKINKLNDDTTL